MACETPCFFDRFRLSKATGRFDIFAKVKLNFKSHRDIALSIERGCRKTCIQVISHETDFFFLTHTTMILFFKKNFRLVPDLVFHRGNNITVNPALIMCQNWHQLAFGASGDTAKSPCETKVRRWAFGKDTSPKCSETLFEEEGSRGSR